MNPLILTLVLVSLSACGPSNSSQKRADTVQMRHAVGEDEPALPGPNPQKKRVNAAGEEGPPIEMFSPHSGESFVTSTGIEVEVMILELSARGGEFAMELAQGEDVTRISYSGTPLYFEGVAFGQLYTISAEGDLATVDFRQAIAESPLDLRSAAEVAIPTMNELPSCQGSQGVSMQAETNGTVLIHGTKEPSSRETEGKQILCSVRVGLYSRQIVN